MKAQHGFTLVELIISLFISLLLIASVFSVYISTNKSLWLTNALSHNQEAGRFSMDFLTHHIRFAGFTEGTGQSPRAIVKAPCGNNFCSLDDVDGSDIFVISFFAPEGYQDCTGNGVPHGDLVLSKFSVVDSVLQCAVSLDGGESVARTAKLLSDVESIQFLAGNESKVLGIQGDYNSDDITMIRVAILVSSPDVNTSGQSAIEKKPREFALLNKKIGEYNDTRIRNVFSTSVYLENNI